MSLFDVPTKRQWYTWSELVELTRAAEVLVVRLRRAA